MASAGEWKCACVSVCSGGEPVEFTQNKTTNGLGSKLHLHSEIEIITNENERNEYKGNQCLSILNVTLAALGHSASQKDKAK